MNSIITRILLLATGILFTTVSFAQDTPEMADIMRSNGKIYVVVVVMLIILIGLFLYVWRVERKVKRLEEGRS
jgi:EamA domain-containing membrane protein RarD